VERDTPGRHRGGLVQRRHDRVEAVAAHPVQEWIAFIGLPGDRAQIFRERLAKFLRDETGEGSARLDVRAV
jgi:hypothetical protein